MGGSANSTRPRVTSIAARWPIRATVGRLSKDELLQIAVSHNINVAKSWKKDQIAESLLTNEAARCALGAKASENLVQLRRDVGPAFDAWRARVVAVRRVALCLACS